MVKLSVGGQLLEIELKLLTKISGSILKDLFTGKIVAAVDDEGQIVIDSEPEHFKEMLKYLREDRTWLPPAEDEVMRDLVETEIRKWRVDVGLARPSVLTTKVAKEFQAILNSKPDMNFCRDKSSLITWNEVGPISLSWLA